MARALERQLRRGPRGGAAVCVYQGGEKVVDIWGGVKDSAGTPWQADTMSVSFSTTKGVTSTALHVLADRGLLDYDDPVAKYWPEFAREGKERVITGALRARTSVMCVQSRIRAASSIIARMPYRPAW